MYRQPSPGQTGQPDLPRRSLVQFSESQERLRTSENLMGSSDAAFESNNEYDVQVERIQDRRSIGGVVYGPPPSAQPGHYKLPAPNGPPEERVARLTGADFMKRSANAVVEVLLEEPRVSIRTRQRKASSIGEAKGQDGAKFETPPIVRQNPKRIRIRSPKLLRTLELIAQSIGQSFLTGGTASLVSNDLCLRSTSTDHRSRSFCIRSSCSCTWKVISGPKSQSSRLR